MATIVRNRLAAGWALLLRLFERLGFRVWFRYEKYREEFRRGDLVIAVDESPIGTFVELEGSEEDILAMARTLERPASDFVLDSYLALFRRHCAAQGTGALEGQGADDADVGAVGPEPLRFVEQLEGSAVARAPELDRCTQQVQRPDMGTSLYGLIDQGRGLVE